MLALIVAVGAEWTGRKTMATDKTAGLEGIIAGDTTIATVGKEGKGLTYRGYSIYDSPNNRRSRPRIFSSTAVYRIRLN